MKVFLGVVAAVLAVVSMVDAPKPDPETTDPEVVAATVVPSGLTGRIGYGFGAIGSHLSSGMVLSTAASVQNDLHTMRKSLKNKKGKDGEIARQAAKTAAEASQLAIQSIYTADPIAAVRNAMKAKNHLDVAKRTLSMPNN